jgi:hypothetical protein
MMGIASPTGSHLPVLEWAVQAMPADALMIEHGAGLYSTVLLARLGVRVLCAEPHKGWAEWASWVYDDGPGKVGSFDDAMAALPEAAVVFLDGPAKERGVLLTAALDRGVPVVIAHDTNKREFNYYGFTAAQFSDERYEITHHAEDSHRTTVWKRK